MIKKNGKVVGTRPEQLFDEFQLAQGLGLVHDVELPFTDNGTRYVFQLDFARPTDSTFDIDFEIDGAAYHSSDIQLKKDAWKDAVKNRHGLKVVHVPASVCERVHWDYLRASVNRAILSKEATVKIAG